MIELHGRLDPVKTLQGTMKAVAGDVYDVPPVYIQPKLQEKTVTQNGEYTPDSGYDGLSKVHVDVPVPSGILVVTENGEYDATRYAKVDVDVPTGGGADSHIPPEISTEAEMNALLKTAEVGAVYKYVGETTDKYENGVKYELCEE